MPALTVVHRDEHLVVVDKPAGVLVVSAPGRSTPTLQDLLTEQLGQRVFAVHRLDEDTTGAIAFALTEAARTAMETLFRDHSITREYLALTTAAPSPAAGRIAANLAEDAAGVVRVVAKGGQPAVTHYETVGRRERCTLVRCRLETGRRNQIRVHLAALGCPVAGDRKYGYRARPGEDHRRVMLHSWRMQFLHPITGTPVDVTIEPREEQLRP